MAWDSYASYWLLKEDGWKSVERETPDDGAFVRLEQYVHHSSPYSDEEHTWKTVWESSDTGKVSDLRKAFGTQPHVERVLGLYSRPHKKPEPMKLTLPLKKKPSDKS